MTPPASTKPLTPQQEQLAQLTECHAYTDEDYPYCNDRGEPCRYKHRANCPDYKSVLHNQVECDVRQGTTFAQQLVSDAMKEPIRTRGPVQQVPAADICMDCDREPATCKNDPSKCQHDPVDFAALIAQAREDVIAELEQMHSKMIETGKRVEDRDVFIRAHGIKDAIALLRGKEE